MKVFEIPKRSPCLNVCDYFLWAEVNRRMREQEKNFSIGKRETRKAFLSRLRRTALSLPPDRRRHRGIWRHEAPVLTLGRSCWWEH